MNLFRLKLFAIIIIALMDFSILHADTRFIIEGASGFRSPNAPFSEHWNGGVTNGGLLYREFAFRGTAVINKQVSMSLMVGWLKDRNVPGIIQFGCGEPPNPMPPYQPYNHSYSRDVIYYVPSIKLSSQFVRLDLGMRIYQLSNKMAGAIFDYSSFDRRDSGPVIGIELGEPGFYVLGKYYDGFPLYSGGGKLEIGLGGRYKGELENKLFFSTAPNEYLGFGYRGEFGLYKSFSFLLGLMVGGTEHQDQYSAMIGIRTSLK